MDYFELIARRESCREYRAQPVEREKLLRCIEAARLAPSACNSQPWSFVVVNDPALSSRLAKCTQGMGMNRFTDQAPVFVVVIEEKATLSARVGGAVKSQQYAPIDLGLAVGQLCLAATAQGLGSCIMGWFEEQKIKTLLGIGREKRIRLVVSLGYPARQQPRPKKRKPMAEICRYLGQGGEDGHEHPDLCQKEVL